jgi:hypothetical protein
MGEISICQFIRWSNTFESVVFWHMKRNFLHHLALEDTFLGCTLARFEFCMGLSLAPVNRD